MTSYLFKKLLWAVSFSLILRFENNIKKFRIAVGAIQHNPLSPPFLPLRQLIQH